MDRTLLAKQTCHVYKIPPGQTSSQGWKANSWALDNPEWTGKLRLVSKGEGCAIRLEERGSGKLYAECPIEAHPSPAVESVTDSSRYFVIRVSDSGRTAHLGVGFDDRSDAFDVNVAISVSQ